MDSTRQNKFSRLIQKELSELFQRENIISFQGAMLTVTNVRVSTDLSLAKVFISLFNAKDKQALLNEIKNNTKEIRKRLGAKIKNQVRHVPELAFFIDDSLDYVENMERIFRNIKKSPEGDKDF